LGALILLITIHFDKTQREEGNVKSSAVPLAFSEYGIAAKPPDCPIIYIYGVFLKNEKSLSNRHEICPPTAFGRKPFS
jgi:hypothetical protein